MITSFFCCHTYNIHVFRYLYSQCDIGTTEKQTHKKGALPHTFPSLGVVFSATISAPADTISLSAHILIVFSNTIRISTLTFLISTHLLQKKLKKSSEDSEDFQHFGVIYSNVEDFLYTNDRDDSHLLQFLRDESSQDYGVCQHQLVFVAYHWAWFHPIRFRPDIRQYEQ